VVKKKHTDIGTRILTQRGTQRKKEFLAMWTKKRERCLIIRIEYTKCQNNPDQARHAFIDPNKPRVASYTGFK
jgi:hypothetical protein